MNNPTPLQFAGSGLRAGRRRAGNAPAGNALIEYVVPAALLLLTAGVLLTLTDLNKVLAEYFMAASGNTQSNLSGGVFKTDALPGPGVGAPGNGSGGFTAYATMTDGNNQASPNTGTGILFTGPVARSGARLASTSAEYLYP